MLLKGHPASDPLVKYYLQASTLFYRSLSFYGFAFFVWLLERVFCPYYPAAGTETTLALRVQLEAISAIPRTFYMLVPYFHAVWHVFTAAASYEFVLFLAVARGDSDLGAGYQSTRVAYGVFEVV